MGPTTPLWQRHQALTPQRFGLIPFRSPLLRDSLFVFSSSGYLDVSIPPVPSTGPMYSDLGTSALPLVGFPIRTSPDQRLLCVSPKLFAACHVLHRLLAPRHPPYALSSLTIKTRSHARACPPKPTGRASDHAHCVCVVGKNYRLQDIQLSNINRGRRP